MQIPIRNLFLKKYELQAIQPNTILIYDDPSYKFALYIVFKESFQTMVASEKPWLTKACRIPRKNLTTDETIAVFLKIALQPKLKNTPQFFRLPTKEEHEFFEKSLKNSIAPFKKLK